MSKKILHLTVTKIWFNLMAKGIKKIEYREIKEYWLLRLKDHNYKGDVLDPEAFLKFDEIHIKNGYNKNSPLAVFKHIKTDLTPPRLINYSDGTKLHLKTSCYRIWLGELIKTKNYDPNPI